MQKDNSHGVIVTLSGPEKKGGHYVYSIVGNDKNGEFNTVRRYSDFNNLRNVLASKWPGCYIPSLPEKKFIGNQDTTFIELRKQGLEYFIYILKQLQHLWYSEETQLFLRKIGDTEKELQKLKETNITQILQKYKQQFPQFFNKQIFKDLNSEIIDFSQYLKKAKGLLQNLQKMVDQIFNARKKYNQKYSNLVQVIIPDYEKSSMEVYINENNFFQLAFTSSKKEKLQPFYQEFKKKTNSALCVLEEIRRQKSQILSFQDVLKVKENYSIQKQKAISKVKDLEIETTKIHSGKQSLMSKIKSKSKDQQLKQNEASIQKAQEEEKNLALFCEIIALILGESQIQKFKNFRQKSYYSLLKKMFELQKQQCQLKKDFWSLVLKENHQKEELDNFFEREKSPMKEKQQIQEPNNIGTSEQQQKQQQEQLEPQVGQEHGTQLNEENDEEPQQVQINHVEDVQVEEIKSEEENQGETDNHVIQE